MTEIKSLYGTLLKTVESDTLIGADLRGVDLIGADLRGIDLSCVNLSGADLSGADFSGANLSGADISMANLNLADLIGTNLRGANLSGTNLRGADLNNIVMNWASHDLIAERLRRLAGNNVARLSFAGLVLLQKAENWCWSEFLALGTPEVDWALDVLKDFVTEGDNAPECLKKRALVPHRTTEKELTL